MKFFEVIPLYLLLTCFIKFALSVSLRGKLKTKEEPEERWKDDTKIIGHDEIGDLFNDIVHFRYEEPYKEPLEERKFAEERRYERNRIIAMKKLEDKDKEGFKKIISKQNQQIQDLSKMAEMVRGMAEDDPSGVFDDTIFNKNPFMPSFKEKTQEKAENHQEDILNIYDMIQNKKDSQDLENAEPPRVGKSISLSEVQRSWDDLKVKEKKDGKEGEAPFSAPAAKTTVATKKLRSH